MLFLDDLIYIHIPLHTSANAGPLLAQRRRRWANIGPALGIMLLE